MCGIAGYQFLTNNPLSIDESLLDKMQSALLHRGPDGYRSWISENKRIGFIHRRLSIVDLSDAGMQPMFNNDKSIAVICNGEIYNHLALRRELESLGYHYASKSDTETIAHAYQEWGISFLERLNGMFSIGLYDNRSNELYLIRDRIGIKPLYFSVQNNILSFSSEIKALWCLPWINKKINPLGLYHYLTYMVTPAPFTLYKHIYKLPAGYYLKVDQHGNFSFSQWYNLAAQLSRSSVSNFEEKNTIVQIQSILRNSVKQQMQSDVPYGVFLSGGVDSSLNVALMSEFTDQVKTFTISFDDGPELNEIEWARKVAKYFNTDHHELLISEKDAFEFYASMVNYQDEPLADCVCIPLYYVSKLLKDSSVTVVQVGEGADELFCGYDLYARYIEFNESYFRQVTNYLPKPTTKLLYHAFSQFFPHKINRIDLLSKLPKNRHLFWSGAIAFPEYLKKNFFNLNNNLICSDPIIDALYPNFNQGLDSYAIVEYHLKKLYEYKPDADFLTRIIWLELQQRLPELLLMRVDKMTMATSVEGRVPFLDHTLVEFALQIPSTLKYKNGITKYVLKKAAEDFLPHEIIYRKKMGFAAPITRWFKEGAYFKSYLRDLVTQKDQWWHEFIKPKSIEELLKSNENRKLDYSLQLWTLQNLISLEL